MEPKPKFCGIAHILSILLINEGYDIVDIILNLNPK